MRPVLPLPLGLAFALAGCSSGGAPATPPELSAPYSTGSGRVTVFHLVRTACRRD